MALTIQATSGGTVSSRTEGYLVFAEGGGAGVVNTYGSAPDSATVTLAGMSQGLPGARTTELHLPPPSGRILQEPVSVSGKEN